MAKKKKTVKIPSKAIGKWSAPVILLALTFVCGLGLHTVFLAAASLLSLPPVFGFINKKLKNKKYIIVSAIAVIFSFGFFFFANQDGDVTRYAQEQGLIQTQTTTRGPVVEDDQKAHNKKFDSNEDILNGIDTVPGITADNLPKFTGEPYVVIGDNTPSFPEKQLKVNKAFEAYSTLDNLGRCGNAFAGVCIDTMPTEKRGSISEVKPSGWVSSKYDFVDGQSLYNRCHLIGFQLTAENANKRNLITGTRYMNTRGMLPFENMVADYVKETKNHVLYRVTPVFVGNELVARGVQMEAYSVEDNGDGICYNVFCFNVQPGVTINYADGSSKADGTIPQSTTAAASSAKQTYILNTKSKKFHLPGCSGVKDINSENKSEFKGTRDEVVKKGYDPCGKCCP